MTILLIIHPQLCGRGGGPVTLNMTNNDNSSLGFTLHMTRLHHLIYLMGTDIDTVIIWGHRLIGIKIYEV